MREKRREVLEKREVENEDEKVTNPEPFYTRSVHFLGPPGRFGFESIQSVHIHQSTTPELSPHLSPLVVGGLPLLSLFRSSEQKVTRLNDSPQGIKKSFLFIWTPRTA
jgi:hypothetical protein